MGASRWPRSIVPGCCTSRCRRQSRRRPGGRAAQAVRRPPRPWRSRCRRCRDRRTPWRRGTDGARAARGRSGSLPPRSPRRPAARPRCAASRGPEASGLGPCRRAPGCGPLRASPTSSTRRAPQSPRRPSPPPRCRACARAGAQARRASPSRPRAARSRPRAGVLPHLPVPEPDLDHREPFGHRLDIAVDGHAQDVRTDAEHEVVG